MHILFHFSLSNVILACRSCLRMQARQTMDVSFFPLLLRFVRFIFVNSKFFHSISRKPQSPKHTLSHKKNPKQYHIPPKSSRQRSRGFPLAEIVSSKMIWCNSNATFPPKCLPNFFKMVIVPWRLQNCSISAVEKCWMAIFNVLFDNSSILQCIIKHRKITLKWITLGGNDNDSGSIAFASLVPFHIKYNTHHSNTHYTWAY